MLHHRLRTGRSERRRARLRLGRPGDGWPDQHHRRTGRPAGGGPAEGRHRHRGRRVGASTSTCIAGLYRRTRGKSGDRFLRQWSGSESLWQCLRQLGALSGLHGQRRRGRRGGRQRPTVARVPRSDRAARLGRRPALAGSQGTHCRVRNWIALFEPLGIPAVPSTTTGRSSRKLRSFIAAFASIWHAKKAVSCPRSRARCACAARRRLMDDRRPPWTMRPMKFLQICLDWTHLESTTCKPAASSKVAVLLRSLEWPAPIDQRLAFVVPNPTVPIGRALPSRHPRRFPRSHATVVLPRTWSR